MGEGLASAREGARKKRGMIMVRLLVLGSGDAFGSGGRNFSAFALTSRGRHVLLDCGPSTLPTLKAAGLDPADVEAILISHCHGDHFGGLPYFFIDYQFVSERDKPLLIIGPEGIESRCEALVQATYPDVIRAHEWRFQVDYREMVPGQKYSQGALAIEAFGMEHGPIPARGYRVGWHGAVIGYTGDTRWTDRIMDLARGCDLLLCECFFFEQDHHSHVRYWDIVEHRHELHAKRVMLFHLGPEMLERLEEVEMEVAADGLVVEIVPSPPTPSTRGGEVS